MESEIKGFPSIVALFKLCGSRKLTIAQLLDIYIENNLGRGSPKIELDTLRNQIAKFNRAYSKETAVLLLPCSDPLCRLTAPHRVCSDKSTLRWINEEMRSRLFPNPTPSVPASSPERPWLNTLGDVDRAQWQLYERQLRSAQIKLGKYQEELSRSL